MRFLPSLEATSVCRTEYWNVIVAGDPVSEVKPFACYVFERRHCEPFEECLPCELNDPVTVHGSTATDTGVVGFSIGFVPWANCSFISSDLANNGAPLFAAALAWDGDIGEWAIHHRGYHYMSGHTTRLTGGLSLTAAAFLWIIGGNLLVHPDCGPDQWFCLETDIRNNWPLTLSVALSAPP